MWIVENEIASGNVAITEIVVRRKTANGNLSKTFLTYKTIKMKMELIRENRTDNGVELFYTIEIRKYFNVVKCKRNKQETKRNAIDMQMEIARERKKGIMIAIK